MVSAIFNPARWQSVEGFNFKDITFHRAVDQGTVRIAFNRPEVRNAFRPQHGGRAVPRRSRPPAS